MKKEYLEEYNNIKENFVKTSDLLLAIGDPTRQHIIISMMELPCEAEGGARVGDITAKTNLSRPAISHHLKILKEAGIISMRRVGTMNFYAISSKQDNLLSLKNLLTDIITLSDKLNKK